MNIPSEVLQEVERQFPWRTEELELPHHSKINGYNYCTWAGGSHTTTTCEDIYKLWQEGLRGVHTFKFKTPRYSEAEGWYLTCDIDEFVQCYLRAML